MLNTPKRTVPLLAFAVTFALVASAAAIAASVRLPLSGMGTQRGATITGLKSTPKRAPTHAMGAVSQIKAPMMRLKGPPIVASGMGRLQGATIMGLKTTPKRRATTGAKPS